MELNYNRVELRGVAEDARHARAPQGEALQVVAVLDARMDEVYAARYAWDGARWSPGGDWSVGKPEALAGEGPVDGDELGGHGVGESSDL